MSLLQNEEFLIYQLRTAYLTHIKDGVGERLINVDTKVLNDPSFRDAGWAANTVEIKRTYSPPIPTGFTSDYFQVPTRANTSIGVEDDEEGGLVTGAAAGTDAMGTTLHTRRRRKKEQQADDDSSSLSDESDADDDAGEQRAAQQIRFNKMPVRSRAGSSPVPESRIKEGPSLLVISPSRPPDGNALSKASVGSSTIQAIKQRARRDTVTSSELSSDNELEVPAGQTRRKLPASARVAMASQILADKIQEEVAAGDGDEANNISGIDEFADEDIAEESDMSSEFEDEVGSHTLLDHGSEGSTSSPATLSRNRSREAQGFAKGIMNDSLQPLPPPRPISTIQPASALTMALKAKNKSKADPVQRFATLTGNADQSPLYIKILPPPETAVDSPIEIMLRRATNEGLPVTVAHAIGLALWQYGDKKIMPPLDANKRNVNRWVLRMVEDGEVDFDFPALQRTRPITDFTSNNNRGARGRSREKPWDEFALVAASEQEATENERQTPDFGNSGLEETRTDEPRDQEPAAPVPQPSVQSLPGAFPSTASSLNPITQPRFATSVLRKDTGTLMDAPTTPTTHSTPRTGASKTLTIHFTDHDLHMQKFDLTVTADTYLAEVFDLTCKRLNLDKALFVLRVTNTNTVAPSDRTVEALGVRADLDLVRRRFVGDAAYGLSGSPGGSSPNAPLFLTNSGSMPTKKGKRPTHPLATQQEMYNSTTTTTTSSATALFKRYNVIRKQPMSFTPSQPRILVLDGEYMYIMPAETGGLRVGTGAQQATLQDTNFQAAPGKTTTVHFSSIVGCKVSRKHPKLIRVLVYRERETKRYDFEAHDPTEAAEIAFDIKKGIEPFTKEEYA